MNTDNMTISGETIDYGPCAFLDIFDPAASFSSIDTGGRYAYGNQPMIAEWNLARFAEALLPLLDEDADAAVELAVASLGRFRERYSAAWSAGVRAKLGLSAELCRQRRPGRWSTPCSPSSSRAASTTPGSSAGCPGRPAATRSRCGSCSWTWPASTAGSTAGARWTRTPASMDRVNPVYIPRNHLVEEALAAATAGDLAPLRALLDAVGRPFDERPGLERYAAPAPVDVALPDVLRDLTARARSVRRPSPGTQRSCAGRRWHEQQPPGMMQRRSRPTATSPWSAHGLDQSRLLDHDPGGRAAGDRRHRAAGGGGDRRGRVADRAGRGGVQPGDHRRRCHL